MFYIIINKNKSKWGKKQFLKIRNKMKQTSFPLYSIGGITTQRGNISGIPLAVQWLGLCTSAAGGTGSIPGRGTKILQAAWHGQKKKKKKRKHFND